MRSKKREFGDLGEALACRLLVKNGFEIVERNFWRPCGEIDIVALKNGQVHFVEVKTVTYRTSDRSNRWGSHSAEENISRQKLGRLRKVTVLYLREYKVKNDFKFMVISVSVEKLANGKIRPQYDVFYDVL
jgi:putative endonuclease